MTFTSVMRSLTGPHPRNRSPLIRSLAALTLAAGWLVSGNAGATLATGGSETNLSIGATVYRIHTFTTNGSLTIIRGGDIEYLVVGGGGGGGSGWQGGGGGAGGFLAGKALVTNGIYGVVVGAGGGANADGQASSITGIAVARGGGKGGSEGLKAGNGGSGGGGSHGGGHPGGAGTEGQGYGGGKGGPLAGGGGGGAGGPGRDVKDHEATFAGGSGRTSAISGAERMYAAGGAGHRRMPAIAGTAGEANTGNGGGGGAGGNSPTGVGGAGGSGLVIVRYPLALTIENGPAADVSTNGATCNAWLISSGGSTATVCLLWGEQDGSRGGSWARTNVWKPGAWSEGSRPHVKVKLPANRGYFYTFGAFNTATSVTATGAVAFITGPLEVTAPRRECTEEKPGEFVISRPAGTTNGALAVHFTLGGTAVNGLDYDRIASPTVIPAGATSVSLKLSPIFNFSSQQIKIVDLTLAPGAYAISARNSARILTRPPAGSN